MAESHVVSGLVAKRGELAGEAQTLSPGVAAAGGRVGPSGRDDPSVCPGLRPRRHSARRQRRGQRWFGPGECQRLVLEVLRDAEGPLSDQGVTVAVAARKGLQGRPEVLAPLQKTTLAVLRRLADKGAARRVGLADGARAWERTPGVQAARRSGRRVLPCQ